MYISGHNSNAVYTNRSCHTSSNNTEHHTTYKTLYISWYEKAMALTLMWIYVLHCSKHRIENSVNFPPNFDKEAQFLIDYDRGVSFSVNFHQTLIE